MMIIIADADQDFCELLEYSIRAVMPSVQLEAVYDGGTLLQRVEERQP